MSVEHLPWDSLEGPIYHARELKPRKQWVTYDQDLTCMVRQLQPTETGIPLELYFFSANKVWAVSYTHLDVYKRQSLYNWKYSFRS